MEEAKHVGFRGKPACGEDASQSAVTTQQVSGTLWANAASAGQPIGRIAAKRDEIWHLFRIDPVTLPDFGRADARDLTAAQRMQDCRRFGGKLKCVPITARDQRRPAAPLLGGNRGGEQAIRP